jgi:hypothetical protein
MKTRLILLSSLLVTAFLLSGCETVDEANATVPWGAPASFEGAGVGLPTINEGDQ